MASSIMNNPWTTQSSHQLFERINFALAVNDNRFILVAGGYKRGEALRSAAMYDMHTSTCSALPDLPSRMYSCKGAISNGNFYVVGLSKIYRMSLFMRSKWELVQSPEIIRNVHDVVSDGNYLFIFYNDGRMIFLYDPVTNKFNIIPRMIRPRSGGAATIVGDKIFIIGGGNCSHISSSVDVYNISTQTWKEAPPLPRPLKNAAATTTGDFIVVTGGNHNKDCKSSQTFIFDIMKQKWFQKDVGLSPPRGYHGCVVIGSEIVSVGGKDDFYGTNYYSLETIHRKHLVPKWESIKHFVLIRQLLDEGRANLIIPKKKMKEDENATRKRAFEKLVIDMNLDIFREILLFLI